MALHPVSSHREHLHKAGEPDQFHSIITLWSLAAGCQAAAKNKAGLLTVSTLCRGHVVVNSERYDSFYYRLALSSVCLKLAWHLDHTCT